MHTQHTAPLLDRFLSNFSKSSIFKFVISMATTKGSVYTLRNVEKAAGREANVTNLQARMSVLLSKIELSASEAQHQQVFIF